MMAQVVDELFSYWTLEDSEDTLEQLEDLLIVRSGLCTADNSANGCASFRITKIYRILRCH